MLRTLPDESTGVHRGAPRHRREGSARERRRFRSRPPAAPPGPRSGAAATLPRLLATGGYRGSWLRWDLFAGVAVACYVIPQAVAYAATAGLPAATGLGTAIVALLVYAALGVSRVASVGPESTLTPLIGATVAPMAHGDPARAVALAATLSLVVAGWCMVARLARLSSLADLISWPVRVGYLAGAAILMIVGQLGTVTGTPTAVEGVASRLRSFVAGAGATRAAPLAVAVGTLLLLLLLDALAPRLPGALIALTAATVACAVTGAAGHGVALLGPVRWSPPSPHLPAVSGQDVQLLLLVGLGVAGMAYGNTVMITTGAGRRSGAPDDVDLRQELVALAGVHAVLGLTGGFPVAASNSRTATAAAARARSQVHSLVTAGIVAAMLLLEAPLLAQLPKAATAALVVFAAGRLVSWREFGRLARFRRAEMLLAVATTVGTVCLGMIVGVTAAIALSFVQIAQRLARPQHGVIARRPGRHGHHRVNDHPDAQPIPGLIIYRFDAPLFFANAHDLVRGVLRAVDEQAARASVGWVVLNVEASGEIDITAADCLQALCLALRRRGVVLALARVKPGPMSLLDRAGLTRLIGEHLIFATLPQAEDAYLTNRLRPVPSGPAA